jgi:hypothetical protein
MMTTTANAPAESPLNLSWPPGALARTLGPETNDALAFENFALPATEAEVTVFVEPPLKDWSP